MARTTLIVFAALLTLPLIAGDTQPRTRKVHIEYKAVVQNLPETLKRFDLWLPLPHDNDFQQVANLKIDSPYAYTTASGSEGKLMLHIGPGKPPERAFAVTVSFDAVRQEHLQSRLSGGPRLERDESPAELARYLKPDRLVPIDGKIREWAHEVVEAAHATTDLEMARAIYNHVVSTVKYDKTGQGWGRGDIYYACDARRGNCTDFHAIFIGYARALGIPARFAIGLPLPAAHGAGKIAGYHCWAEFYAKGIGWVPVDASEAGKDPSRREYFFGAHDENRIEFSRGRDVILTPRQAGDPLNFFIYPYAEVDGSPFTGTTFEIVYRDM